MLMIKREKQLIWNTKMLKCLIFNNKMNKKTLWKVKLKESSIFFNWMMNHQI